MIEHSVALNTPPKMLVSKFGSRWTSLAAVTKVNVINCPKHQIC
jgi:hypothetical protein